ncbi:TRAP transporter small permease [Propionivibrio dicarboxylicus]|uniref:TRAP transporter small permease protein n=1 Tax=Propionivibrio dicarboxylicus TaxID=83767 RepID=A0A1G8A503_9RHOO|nr:TRAP transporter small permease [Propionivibrio dicarboxylicus]SDH16019.1 TRAP-type C4-dicarboxylate transport system, small permease component [Propionivibrio dicarboxylicus]
MTSPITAKLDKGFNAILAICLGLMGILIFLNVLLRYCFNSGLPWAEEFSRFLFVWLTFLGAIGALKDNAHLGFTSLVQKLPPTGKKIAYILSNAIVLYCLAALFEGSWEMTTMSAHTLSPATGLPLSYMYGIGVIMGIGMFGIVFFKLYRALFVKGAIDELVVLRESEDDRDFSADADHHAQQGDKK